MNYVTMQFSVLNVTSAAIEQNGQDVTILEYITDAICRNPVSVQVADNKIKLHDAYCACNMQNVQARKINAMRENTWQVKHTMYGEVGKKYIPTNYDMCRNINLKATYPHGDVAYSAYF